MTSERDPGDRAFWDQEAERAEEKVEALAVEARVEELAADRPAYRRAEETIVEWARAIALGIRDTAKDILDEGREGARRKQSEMWDRFDSKTKGRRTRH
jgi:hypothetical protein